MSNAARCRTAATATPTPCPVRDRRRRRGHRRGQDHVGESRKLSTTSSPLRPTTTASPRGSATSSPSNPRCGPTRRRSSTSPRVPSPMGRESPSTSRMRPGQVTGYIVQLSNINQLHPPRAHGSNSTVLSAQNRSGEVGPARPGAPGDQHQVRPHASTRSPVTAPVRAPLLLHHPVVIAQVRGARGGRGRQVEARWMGRATACSSSRAATSTAPPATTPRRSAAATPAAQCRHAPRGTCRSPPPGVLVYGAASCFLIAAGPAWRCALSTPIPPSHVAPIGRSLREIRTLARFLSGVTVTGGEPTIEPRRWPPCSSPSRPIPSWGGSPP